RTKNRSTGAGRRTNSDSRGRTNRLSRWGMVAIVVVVPLVACRGLAAISRTGQHGPGTETFRPFAGPTVTPAAAADMNGLTDQTGSRATFSYQGSGGASSTEAGA